MTEENILEENAAEELKNSLPPIKLAFIIDGEVADILHTDDRLAAIFTSDPLVLDITERINTEQIGVGYIYNQESDKFEMRTE